MLGRRPPSCAGQRKSICRLFVLLVVIWPMASAWAATVEVPDRPALHYRLAWGGGSARSWRGRISIDRGAVLEVRPLGLEADAAGTAWIEDGDVVIRQAGARVYDGLDLAVEAPADAQLTIDLQPADTTSQVEPVRVALASLSQELTRRSLDANGNSLSLGRAPGDLLAVVLNRRALVFAAGEEWAVQIVPRIPGLAAGTELQIEAQLRKARGEETFWTATQSIQMSGRDPTPVEWVVPLPADEGAYDLRLVASRLRFNRLVPAKPVAERTIQVVVVQPEQDPAPLDAPGLWTLVDQIDPTKPGWWKRSIPWRSFSRIPNWSRGPLGSGSTSAFSASQDGFIRLRASAGQPSWQAYPLPVRSPGQPHLVEVDYPRGVEQRLDFSLIEPNSAGRVWPLGVDSGVYASASRDRAAGLARHRIVFWPKTRTPYLLLVNRSPRKDAAFGKIRVMSTGQQLPRSFPAEGPTGGRLVGGYFDRPVFPENFSATDALDKDIEQNVNDWVTFYDGASRLVQYMHYAGMNSLMLTVLADGSAIYPTQVMDSTPLYDTGILSSEGQDPFRKDVLELVLRLFDREGFQLVPTLQFAAPLRDLERARRQSVAARDGIEWVGRDGRTWRQSHTPRRGLAPYYNPLNERVQEEMLRIVREVAERYGHHRSFHGLGLQLGSHGYAQLMGPEWGLDDATIARFEKDTRIRLPHAGDDRFARRYDILTGKHREAWLAWRARQLALFYERIQQVVAASHRGARLYLAATTLFDHPDLEQRLRPTLPRQSKVLPALLHLGIHPDLYDDNEAIVLLRPHLFAPPKPLLARGRDIQINHDVPLDQQLAASKIPGSLLFHRPQRLRLPSFDEKSPFGKDKTYTLLYAQPLPPADENRRRFVHSLAALDAQAIFDGGFMLPLGQEPALREWIDIYRQLPADDFRKQTVYRQPVTIRALDQGGTTWIYAANDSPWNVRVRIPLDASGPARIRTLGKHPISETVARDAQGAAWSLALGPYGLSAAKVTGARLGASLPEIDVDAAITEGLKEKIYDLQSRATSLRRQPPFDGLTNADFEQSDAEGTIPGWRIAGAPESLAAGADTEQFHADARRGYGGRQSVRLESRQPGASFQSLPFDPPPTGRLAMRVWLRPEDPRQAPLVALGVEGVAADGTVSFRRVAWVGGNRPDVAPFKAGWAEYYTRFDDLLPTRTTQLRVRVDLVGPGTIWLDDIELNHLSFSEKERVGLVKIIASADEKLNSGDLSDCLRILEGYWPRFLEDHVTSVELPVAHRDTKPPVEEEHARKPDEKPGLSRRIINLVPEFLRF